MIQVNLGAAASHYGSEVLRSKLQNLSHLFIMAVWGAGFNFLTRRSAVKQDET